jgi:predicted TIM-barrel fold metal-dependent hydrolase
MFTRRQFLGAAAATVAATRAIQAAQQPAVPFVDVHTHIGTYTNNNKELTVADLLRWMDERGIERAFVLPLVSPDATTYLQTPDFVLRETKPHRDRLIPFCAIDPRAHIVGAVAGFKQVVQRWVDEGAKGFGEHKVGLDFDDPLMFRVYEALEAVGIPLLFHMDNIRGKDQPGLPRLEAALKAFPKLNFIGHGPGFWASISGDVTVQQFGGYPKTKVAPGGALDRLMEQYSNLYADLSAGSGAGAISRDLEFGREFLIRRKSRVMFGTDYLQPGQEVPQFELFATQLKLPPEVHRQIARENALRLVGIPL